MRSTSQNRTALCLALCFVLAAIPVSAAEEGEAASSEPSSGQMRHDQGSSYSEDAWDPAMERHRGWEYDTYYIFPLTRHMPDSELPLAGQIALYPLAFIIDLGQWPFGALAGLAGK